LVKANTIEGSLLTAAQRSTNHPDLTEAFTQRPEQAVFSADKERIKIDWEGSGAVFNG
jgi:hypothetical protein